MRLADHIIALAGLERNKDRKQTQSMATLLRAAMRFDIGTDVIDAAREVNCSRPSSVLSALPLCRLPYPLVWMEAPCTYVNTSERGRVGVLFYSKEEPYQCGRMEVAFHYGDRCKISSVGVMFDWSGQSSAYDAPMDDQAATNPVAKILKDRFKDRKWDFEPRVTHDEAANILRSTTQTTMRRLANDPIECSAIATLLNTRRMCLSAYAGDFLIKRLSQMSTAEIEREMFDRTNFEWVEFVVDDMRTVLLLLHSRNAVTIHEENLTKLNATRTKKKKHPLLDHRTVRLRLTRTQTNRLNASGITRAKGRAHLVRGHFKVRRSGVYWWMPHIRGDTKLGWVVKDYAIVP